MREVAKYDKTTSPARFGPNQATLYARVPLGPLSAASHSPHDEPIRTLSSMSVSAADAQGLLEALRYLWRGTRWSRGKERLVGNPVAGYLFGPRGRIRPFGEIHEAVVLACRRADLDPMERLVVSEYYGLVAFPTDLTSGPSPLLGRVRTSTGRQSDFASRSAITSARKSGVGAIARVLDPAPIETDLPLIPVADPLDDQSLRSRLSKGDDGLDSAVLEACLYAAYDLTDRAVLAEDIRRALDWWRERWITGKPALMATRFSFAARHAAFAALHVSLWNYRVSGNRSDTSDAPAPVVLWAPTAIDSPRAGRVIATERWGVIDQVDLTAADLVCLCGLIFNGEDADGTAADFVIPILAHPDTGPALNRPTHELLVWSVARHLASRGDWRAMELMMAVATSDPPPRDIAEFLAWAAHVASMFHHEALAWRLANQADRLIEQQPGRAPTRRIVLQVRSGILVRSADALLDVNPERGVSELQRSMHYIQQARLARTPRPHPDNVLADIPLKIRLLEALVVAHKYRIRGYDTLIDQAWSLDAIKMGLEDVTDEIVSNVPRDDDDFTVLLGRADRLSNAIAAAEGTLPPVSPD